MRSQQRGGDRHQQLQSGGWFRCSQSPATTQIYIDWVQYQPLRPVRARPPPPTQWKYYRAHNRNPTGTSPHSDGEGGNPLPSLRCVSEAVGRFGMNIRAYIALLSPNRWQMLVIWCLPCMSLSVIRLSDSRKRFARIPRNSCSPCRRHRHISAATAG